MTRKFYQRFTNVEINTDEAQKRFMIRMLNNLFPDYPLISRNGFQLVSVALGKTITHQILLEKIVLDDFHLGIYMINRLYTQISKMEAGFGLLTSSDLSNLIQQELEDADIDLEIEWRDGQFYPRGARLLDEKLVDDPLDWIQNNDLPTVYEPFTKALNHLLRARKDPRLLTDAITDAYDSLEAMAKVVCENDKTFGANTDQYIEKINASREFKKTLREMSKYTHKFRHGASPSEPKPKPTMSEVEAYIYTVGILIRLGTETLEKWKREKPRQKD